MEIKISDVVYSMAGHDKGKLFFVVGVEGDYLLLANGKQGRTLSSPKRKKRMHVQFFRHGDSEAAARLKNGLAVNDKELRIELAKLRDTFSTSDHRSVNDRRSDFQGGK